MKSKIVVGLALCAPDTAGLWKGLPEAVTGRAEQRAGLKKS
jgi:hypothetical protein